MKPNSITKFVFSIAVLFSLSIFSCIFVEDDYGAQTEIQVVNESSYNLHIIFEKISPYLGFNEEVDVQTGESVSFISSSRLGGKDVEPHDANHYTIKITLINSDTDEIIKKMDNMGNDTVFFKYIRGEKYHAWYQFTITDAFDWDI